MFLKIVNNIIGSLIYNILITIPIRFNKLILSKLKLSQNKNKNLEAFKKYKRLDRCILKMKTYKKKMKKKKCC